TEKLQLSDAPGLTLTPAHTRNVITSIQGKPIEIFAWLCSNGSDIAASDFRGIRSQKKKICFTSFGISSSASSWVAWPRRSCIRIYRSHGQWYSVLSARSSEVP